MQKISTCLGFDGTALEAAKFYCSVFKNSRLGKVTRYGKAASKASGQKEGSVMTVTFWLEGREFMGLNGGSMFKFNDAVSLMVACKDQKEIDRYWKKLTAGAGKPVVCGWLIDKYGMRWQIVPANLPWMHATPGRSDRMMAALVKMTKLDKKKLEQAAKGK